MSETNDVDLQQQILELQSKLANLTADKERDAQLASATASRLSMFEAMLEIVPLGVVLTDKTGCIIMGNKAVEQIVRHPVLHSADTDSYGEWISFHADGRQVESSEYPLAKVIDEGVDRAELDVHYQRGDGTRLWMRIIGQPVLDSDDQLIGAVVALVDIDREISLTEQQEVLIGELNHRVKNAFSVVKSIVSQSLRKESIPNGLRRKIDERLDAYAAAHAKLVGSDWSYAGIEGLVRDIVLKIGGENVTYAGPDLNLPSRQALALSMAFYELSTNALKYGALSVPDGTVALEWSCRTTRAARLMDIGA